MVDIESWRRRLRWQNEQLKFCSDLEGGKPGFLKAMIVDSKASIKI